MLVILVIRFDPHHEVLVELERVTHLIILGAQLHANGPGQVFLGDGDPPRIKLAARPLQAVAGHIAAEKRTDVAACLTTVQRRLGLAAARYPTSRPLGLPPPLLGALAAPAPL